MNIQRINTYDDKRFSKKVLCQHGCFLVDGKPYEIEIVSDHEAIVTGEYIKSYDSLIEEFQYYAPHITCFYNSKGKIIKQYPRKELLTITIDKIQPSQFYVDKCKLETIPSFIHRTEDIIIQLCPCADYYISLDGHTRLFYACAQGWTHVRGVVEKADDWVYDFAFEAKRRHIYKPSDMKLISHQEYEEKWNQYCDEYFSVHS